MTSALVVACTAGLITWIVAHRLRGVRPHELVGARRRTLSRYAGASRPARWYVGIKLRTDPSLAAVAALDGPFGRVVDAGCGYLQLGLCLVELGRVSSLVGFDQDDERVAVARAAAGDDARVERADLVSLSFPEADTVLFVDSLHYLPRGAQDAVLERAAGALAAGGRIVVREVDSGASLRSGFTERLERDAAKKRGYSHVLAFRSAADIAAKLESLGLSCTTLQHEELSPVHNALVVGTKRQNRPMTRTPSHGLPG